MDTLKRKSACPRCTPQNFCSGVKKSSNEAIKEKNDPGLLALLSITCYIELAQKQREKNRSHTRFSSQQLFPLASLSDRTLFKRVKLRARITGGTRKYLSLGAVLGNGIWLQICTIINLPINISNKMRKKQHNKDEKKQLSHYVHQLNDRPSQVCYCEWLF